MLSYIGFIFCLLPYPAKREKGKEKERDRQRERDREKQTETETEKDRVRERGFPKGQIVESETSIALKFQMCFLLSPQPQYLDWWEHVADKGLWTHDRHQYKCSYHPRPWALSEIDVSQQWAAWVWVYLQLLVVLCGRASWRRSWLGDKFKASPQWSDILNGIIKHFNLIKGRLVPARNTDSCFPSRHSNLWGLRKGVREFKTLAQCAADQRIKLSGLPMIWSPSLFCLVNLNVPGSLGIPSRVKRTLDSWIWLDFSHLSFESLLVFPSPLSVSPNSQPLPCSSTIHFLTTADRTIWYEFEH